MTRRVGLMINDKVIELDYFVQDFIDHTVGGMVAALEGTGEISSVDISINSDRVTLLLNGDALPMNSFVHDIIRNTLKGLLSTLKGVNSVDKASLSIGR